jgi:F-type H+-transporting ATPase subunit epsilon
MADNLKLDVVTPTGPVANATGVEVPGVEVPGILGEMGVLPQHVPFVSPIVPGVLRFRSAEGSMRVAVDRGFVEVSEGGDVVVLANRAVVGSDVDTPEIQAQLAQIKSDLTAAKDADAGERNALEGELAWLEAQLRAGAN